MIAITDCRGFFPCCSTGFQHIVVSTNKQGGATLLLLDYPSDTLSIVENIEPQEVDETPEPAPQPATVAELMVSPDNPPWNGWMAIGFWALSVAFIVVVPSAFLLPYAITHVDIHDREALTNFIFTDPTAIVLQLAPVILAHILTLVAAWFIVTRFRRFSFRHTLGWDMDGFRVWHAVLLTIAFYLFGFLMTDLFGKVNNDFERLIDGSRVAVYLVAFLATFTAPLVEEVVYRGVLYSAFQRTFGVAASVIFVTLLFTIVHVPQYSQNSVPDYASVITLLALSLTLTLIRVRTGNLLPCIVLHMVFNGIQSLMLVLEPFLPSSTTTTPDPNGFIFHLLK
jgi:membrane protease YdiL (CAAX protease family)